MEKPDFKPQNSLNPRQETALRTRLGAISLLTAAIFIATLFYFFSNSDQTTAVDTDGDGIANVDDLDDDNDGIPDSRECAGSPNFQYSIINGGFESPVISGNYSIMKEDLVDGWLSSSSRNVIEIWKSGFLGIDAYEGNQLAELNAHDAAATYQVFTTVPGDILHWSFAHRGRASATVADVMQIEIGPEGQAYNFSESMSDNNTAWGYYAGTYTVPAGQTETRFALTAISTATGNKSVGNLVDDFQLYSLNNCLVDTDGDGIPNSEDLDSDGDGIMDIVEAGGTDVDNDGEVDYPVAGDPTSMVDADEDGLMDRLDDQDSGSGLGEVMNGSALELFNSDGRGEPDFLDIDADDDGIVDNTEAQRTDNYAKPSGTDTDMDGLDDAYDKDCNPCGTVIGQVIEPTNSGGSILPDYRDTDSDGDAILDEIEAHDTNGDGVVDTDDTPFANTGRSGGNTDSDRDGLLDGFDNDLVNYDPTNGGASGSSFADNNSGTAERSWRESVNFPVEWLDFRVKMDKGDAIVNWATAMEMNNDFFEIQRSVEGTTFESAGKVNGVGISDQPQSYSFVDQGVGKLGENRFYYRIKQVDIDGQFSFSSIEELRITSSQNMDISIYPNPAEDQLNISWNLLESTGSMSVSLMNTEGKVLKSGLVEGISERIEWDVSALPPGLYIIRVKNGSSVLSKKVVLK